MFKRYNEKCEPYLRHIGSGECWHRWRCRWCLRSTPEKKKSIHRNRRCACGKWKQIEHSTFSAGRARARARKNTRRMLACLNSTSSVPICVGLLPAATRGAHEDKNLCRAGIRKNNPVDVAVRNENSVHKKRSLELVIVLQKVFLNEMMHTLCVQKLIQILSYSQISWNADML